MHFFTSCSLKIAGQIPNLQLLGILSKLIRKLFSDALPQKSKAHHSGYVQLPDVSQVHTNAELKRTFQYKIVILLPILGWQHSVWQTDRCVTYTIVTASSSHEKFVKVYKCSVME